MPYELLGNAIASGLLVGGFYAILAVGLTISFGLIDIANVAHPTFILLAAYLVYFLNTIIKVDPIVGGVLLVIPFYLLGNAIYLFYNKTFESRGDTSISGLVLFFGFMILIEVLIAIQFGVDLKGVYTPYNSSALLGFGLVLPLRFFYTFVVGGLTIASIQIFLSKTFRGRAIRAVAQDTQAATLMGVRPLYVKAIALGISLATAAIAGGLLVAVGPITPYMDRNYLGRIFAVVILGGTGSVLGSLIGGIIIGVSENIASIYLGPGWSLVVSSVLLLVVLALRPSGILRR